jgi:hypothetical protein
MAGRKMYEKLLEDLGQPPEADPLRVACTPEKVNGKNTGRMMCVAREKTSVQGKPYINEAGLTLEQQDGSIVKYDEWGSNALQKKMLEHIKPEL